MNTEQLINWLASNSVRSAQRSIHDTRTEMQKIRQHILSHATNEALYEARSELDRLANLIGILVDAEAEFETFLNPKDKEE